VEDENKTKKQLIEELKELRMRSATPEKIAFPDSKQMEKEMQTQMNKLAERVKELDCLYSISNLIETQDISIEGILRGTVELMPRAWQYPDLTCARIVLKDQTYESVYYRESSCRLASNIQANGEQIGIVEVFCLKEPDPDDQTPFLPEEIKLLNAMADRLGREIERKQANVALRESEIKFRTIVENISQKIFIKDKVSCYVSVNENYARDLGIQPEDVKGKSDYDFFPKELAEKYRDDDKRIMRTNHTEHIEEMYVQDGRETWIHTVKAPVKDEQGKITGVFGIFMDITERKQAEEALAAKHHLLDETNIALRVLLRRREEDQKEMERKILDNIQNLVFPHLEKLRSLRLNNVQSNCLDIVTTNLHQITSPFLQNLAARFADFTPREVQVANMIREGKTSKEIASLFNSSIRSVEFHRDNIRKKLGLNQKKTNLSTFLRNLSE